MPAPCGETSKWVRALVDQRWKIRGVAEGGILKQDSKKREKEHLKGYEEKQSCGQEPENSAAGDGERTDVRIVCER